MLFIESIALKSFLYSEDGTTELWASARQPFNCPAKLFDGLNAAGYVRRLQIGDGHITLREKMAPETVAVIPAPSAGPTPEAPSAGILEPAVDIVEIPEEWRTMKFFALRSLANKITTVAITDQASAVAAIEAELQRRVAPSTDEGL